MIHAFVAVIESPSSRDLLDGRTEGRALCEALRLADIPHSYSLATDRGTLSESLGNRLRAAAKQYGTVPIIHFSMHGNTDGVQLTNGEFITWYELRIELTPLLHAMQGTLLVCMSSCFGNAGCRMAMHVDNEPTFWALVGNTESATWSDAAVAYISFYHMFFKEHNLGFCVDSMKSASGDHNFVCHLGEQTRQNWAAYLQEKRQDLIQNAIENPQNPVQ